MSDISYAPLIADMRWSYSRVKTFDDCTYRWYLKYIRKVKSKDLFFSDYGNFMHLLLKMYFSGERTKDELVRAYLREFRTSVIGSAPNKKVFENYFVGGLNYLKDLKPFPYNTLSVETRAEFDVDGIPCIAYIDHIGELNGDIYITDHKSRQLRARSGREKPTRYDQELDEYLKQLYIYGIYIRQQLGKYPKYLLFNCFRGQLLIKEPFCEKNLEETKRWFTSRVEQITNETEFRPDLDWFRCTYLCDCNDYCEYFSLSRR